MNNENKKIKKSYSKFLLFLIPVIIISTILYLRNKFYKNIFINEISYQTLVNIEKSIIKDNFDIILPLIPALNVIMATLTVFFFYKIIMNRKQHSENFISVLTIILYSLSPIFIFTFSTINKFSIIISLSLLTIYFYKKKKYVVSTTSFLIVSIMDVVSMTLLLITIFLFNFERVTNYKFNLKKKGKTNRNKKQKKPFPFFILIVISIFALVSLILSTNNVEFLGVSFSYQNIIEQNIPSGLSHSPINNYFIELGAPYGITFIGFILLTIGIISSWKYKKRFLPIYIILLFTLIISMFYNIQYLMISGLLISLFSAKGIEKIKIITWHFGELKRLSYIIISMTILISLLTFSIYTIDSLPSKELEKYAEAINSKFEKNNITCNIIASEKNKFFLEYKTRNHIITEKNKVISDLLRKRLENNAINVLNDEKTCIIVSDKTLRNSMLNFNNNIGLEFVMENTNGFEVIYEDKLNDVKVWYFKYYHEAFN